MITLRFKESVHATDISPPNMFHFGKEYSLLDRKVSSSMILQRALHSGAAVEIKTTSTPRTVPPSPQVTPRRPRTTMYSVEVGGLRELLEGLAQRVEGLEKVPAPLHNPFVDPSSKVPSHPEDAQGLYQAQLNQIQATLELVVERLDALEQKLSAPKATGPKGKKGASDEDLKRTEG